MNKQGRVPIWVRITVDGKRAEFSTQKQIHPTSWNPNKNRVSENSSDGQSINQYLTLLEADIQKHYNILLSAKDVVTAIDVRNSYRGIKEISKTFFHLFDQYKQRLSERKEIKDLSEGRYKRFKVLYNKCQEFVRPWSISS